MNLTAASLSSLSKPQKIELLTLLEEKQRRLKDRAAVIDYQSLYGWQRKFNLETAAHHVCMLMAANQCIGPHTKIGVIRGKDYQQLQFLEFLRARDANVVCQVDGRRQTENKYSAYFQGVMPAFRLYLSNGEFLDCSGEHQLLDAEGNYCSFQALMLRGGDQHWIDRCQDSMANCGEDDYQCGQQPQLAADSGLRNIPPLTDAQQHIRSAWPEDVRGRIDQYSQALSNVDLLSNLDDLFLIEALIEETVFRLASPSAQLMSELRRVGEQLILGCIHLPQVDEERLHSIVDYDGACSSHIFFPFQAPKLFGEVSILSWHQIGLQPCFDLSVQDANNYETSGVISHNCGKTRTGCLIDAFHLRGDYPDDWDGHRFDGPTTCWLLGYSGEKTRDLLQTKLFGRMQGTTFEGGYIKASDIVDYKSMQGTSGACREVRVKHVSGGISICQFWSYSQGQHALMGDVVDWFHIDEEPRDKSIYPQVLTRTINGDKGRGGRGILTFTPENGRTELVVQFMDNPGPSDYLQRATWDDAPHLTKDTKTRLLSQYPAWQRDMRSKGEPLLGAGLIFDIDDEIIKCQPIQCPDHWWIIDGMDFGWDHPQAHVQLWWDKDDDIVYLAHAWKKSQKKPYEAWAVVKPWAMGVPTAWPNDGLQHEKGSGEEQRKYYSDEGWLMLEEKATWGTGGMSVEQGLVELYRAMDDGKFKVFSHISEFFAEKMNYHRDEKGHIVKVQDDILDAIRYAWMMKRFAVQKCNIAKPNKREPIKYPKHRVA